MKRTLFLIPLSLAAMFATSSLAIGETVPVRAATEKVTSSTTPKRDRTRPYTFTTTGRIVPPSSYCAPGVNPRAGANCIPVVCPQGVTDPRYCFRPSRPNICDGKVTVRFQKRESTVSSRNARVRNDCTYRSRVSFRTHRASRLGVLSVRSRFGGNQFLLPKNSSTHRVRAG